MAGPCAVPVPAKLAQRIRRKEFVDMALLLPECLSQLTEDRPKSDPREETKGKKARRKVVNILQWVECFHTYISVVVVQQPSRVADLLGYASLIVHAARKFKGDGWVQYDRNFRKRAAAAPTEPWAGINQSLWALAFSNAETKPHCSLCFSLEHGTEECDEYEEPKGASSSSRRAAVPQASSFARGSSPRPICVRWNRYGCTAPQCTFRHVCLECHQPHKAAQCSQAARYSPYPRESFRGRDSRVTPRDQREPRVFSSSFRKKGDQEK